MNKRGSGTMEQSKMSKELTKTSYAIDTPQRAKEMALVLAKHIKDNKLSANIAGHDYVQVEGWQFAGGLMGLFPQITEVREIAPMKWLAKAEIRNVKTDKIVGVGYAICSKEEMKKKSFDEYAILSMAQTRAIGKAYRNYIGWIIKMAGYESSPAEEIKAEMVDALIKEKGVKAKGATNYLEQLKAELASRGAKDEKEAVEMINKKTGLIVKDLKITEKNAQMILFSLLNSK